MSVPQTTRIKNLFPGENRKAAFRGFLKTLAAFLILTLSAAAALAKHPPIALHPENPHYFLFRGQPTVLITSAEHYGAVINLDFDYTTYLKTLQAAKLNNTRLFSGAYIESPTDFNITKNPLSPNPGRLIAPWARSDQPGYANGGNKFDLTQWDKNYFNRLRDFMEKASECGVVVEMNLFCPFYGETQWKLSPQNPDNNVNNLGKIEQTNVYTLDKSGGLLAVHEDMTRKIVTELNPFDNLYYEICNEPYTSDSGVTTQWQHHIAELIVQTEKTLPNQHLISQNIANGSEKITKPHPAISIFNFHYAFPPTAVTENYTLNKVIGDNETGFKGTGDAHYRMEAWEFILEGGALYNNLDYSFVPGHEKGDYLYPAKTPGGGNAEFRRQMTVLRNFINSFDFVHMKPDTTFLAGVPEKIKAHAIMQNAKQYAACFFDHDENPKPQSLSLTLLLPQGDYRIEWVDTLTGKTIKQQPVNSPGTITITSPEFLREIALSIRK